jgi:hypothetical protein
VSTAAGVALILGIREPKPIANIPQDVRKVRLRMRNDGFARAFLKFDDRVEHWAIGPADNKTQDCPIWRLVAKQGENRRM